LRAAEALRLMAPDLLHFGLIDGIVQEPPEGAHTDMDRAAEYLKETLRKALEELAPRSSRELIDERYDKFRRMGNFFIEGSA